MQPHRRLLRKGWLFLDRYVKRVTMTSTQTAVETQKSNTKNTSVTKSAVVNALKEIISERPYFFLLFTDLLVQCSRVDSRFVGGTNDDLQSHVDDSDLMINRIVKLNGAADQASLCGCIWIRGNHGENESKCDTSYLRVVGEDVILYLTQLQGASKPGNGTEINAWLNDITGNHEPKV